MRKKGETLRKYTTYVERIKTFLSEAQEENKILKKRIKELENEQKKEN